MTTIRSFQREVLITWLVFSLQDENLNRQLQKILDKLHTNIEANGHFEEFSPSFADSIWFLRLNIMRWASTRGINIGNEIPSVLEWLNDLKTDSLATELFQSVQLAIEASRRVIQRIVRDAPDSMDKPYEVPEELFRLTYSQFREIIKFAETPSRSEILLNIMDASLALELGSLAAIYIYDEKLLVPSEQISDLTIFIRRQTYEYVIAANQLVDFSTQDLMCRLTFTDEWRSFVNDMFGCMSDAPIARYDEGDYETRTELL